MQPEDRCSIDVSTTSAEESMDSTIRDYDLLAKRIDVLQAGWADAVARAALLERPREMAPDHLQAWFADGGADADSAHAGGEEVHRKGVEADDAPQQRNSAPEAPALVEPDATPVAAGAADSRAAAPRRSRWADEADEADAVGAQEAHGLWTSLPRRGPSTSSSCFGTLGGRRC